MAGVGLRAVGGMLRSGVSVVWQSEPWSQISITRPSRREIWEIEWLSVFRNFPF